MNEISDIAAMVDLDVNRYRPHMLPKIRSQAIRDAAEGKPCTARISNIIPGHRCDDGSTTVLCHVTNLGKGQSTKVSDIISFFGCAHCHALVDRVDSRIRWIEESYPAMLADRYQKAMGETLTLLLIGGQIIVPDARIIR